MDGREAMALASGSTPYYIHRGGGVGGSGSGSQAGGFHSPPGFRPLANPNLLAHSNTRPGSSGSSFSIEPSNINFVHGMNVAVPSGLPVGEPVKKKRGRPRKYAPDGQVSLGLSPLPVKPKPSSGQDPLSPKRARGRPPGTGRKQQLALLGEWMNSSAGIAFSPHVIRIGVGEDIVAKVLSFAQQRPRALCILSGTGTVSSVTLRQPASSGPTLTFEGRFEILCLSGSYLVAEDGGPRNRTGGISASLSSPDGHVIGGAIGMLIAAGPVQVVACSFVHGASKVKDKPVGRPKINKESASHSGDKSVTPKPTLPTNVPQSFTPSPMHVWPISRSVDLRNPHSDIDLMRG
ncbi:AT-hook motif nuclear-localized protein 5 [Ricinus communis]|uniref:AT-hook motif nuclear-localized protein n=1 Tax=Ricinus communis TaxID=3988 RepID=B9RCB0_RICCO|nr:AT-hook motif nuclear-localized protein 5 [Ricinus communis]EEF51181.1 DNA binding protein, putative [Ricinus communis]|eukprot:XP_002509794.1 AT-hook motif nuclear-localized protein 5 [Ricinus communis]